MIIKLDFRTKLFMTIVLSYVMVLGNIQTKYFVQAILISTIPIILLINAKYIRVAIIGVATLLLCKENPPLCGGVQKRLSL